MSQKLFFTFVSLLYAVLGLGNLLAPSAFMSGFGLQFDASGDLVARVLGSSAIAIAIICWACREAPPSPLFSAVLYGSITEKLIQVVLVGYALSAGVFNSVGWVMEIMQVLLAVGFAYFAFFQPKPAT